MLPTEYPERQSVTPSIGSDNNAELEETGRVVATSPAARSDAEHPLPAISAIRTSEIPQEARTPDTMRTSIGRHTPNLE
ncbi:hypothetical protein Kisp01_09340 [Kineosporia sp. NBRC 101677]|nr:hypothetical protein Kisp01_09340 [Kineosporia sp. NBRC 101677]